MARYKILDGAMGTILQNSGLQPGHCPEEFCLTHPDVVEKIHCAYLDAGAEILYANTFGANRLKLARSTYSVEEIIPAAVGCARRAAGKRAQVALDIGPLGQLLEPYGTLSFDEAYALFREQVILGRDAGADLIVFETMTDLYEVKAAVLAAKENCNLPVFVTMTFEDTGRTFTGCSVEAMAATLSGLGADAIGLNCSLGPAQLYPIVQKLCALTDLPIIVKANAGLPDPATGAYDISPDAFANEVQQLAALGVQYLGGCCGTNPAYIRALKERLGGSEVPKRDVAHRAVVCTSTCTVTIDGVRVIGERINPTGKKRFQQALRDGDMEYILNLAVQQADAGAHILDVNVGLPGIDEPQMMARVVKAIRTVCDLPLQIDSSDPTAIEAGLRAADGKCIVNSVNGTPAVLESVLPIVKKYGAAVIGLAMDEGGIPPTAEERFTIAERILHAAMRHGIAREDVFIDCLTLTASAEQDKVQETLRAISMVREKLGLQCTLGVSNISFGLPNREKITTGFLTLALAQGLTLPIVNPNSEVIMDAIRVFNVLSGADRDAAAYIASNSVQRLAEPITADALAPEAAFARAVERGFREEAGKRCRALLAQGMTELQIVNTLLIPALDTVGGGFERGELFLPQLINAAGAAQEAFEVIKTNLARNGAASVSKGKIIVATVKGDIHDIGKNIVKTILENYGYTVLDLGRDVAPETVVQTAVEQGVTLIGLSALMTTTLGSMAQTIAALHASGHACKIWVGGAVLTPEYAKTIGADFYAKDAKESVDIAREVLGQ